MSELDLWIRLYLDHNVHPWLAVDLRRRGFDVMVAKEVGNAALSDEDHLRWATDHRRTVLTYDRDDYPGLHEAWLDPGERHHGIIVATAPPRTPPSVLLRRLIRLLDTLTSDEMIGELTWLDGRWDQDRA